MIDVKEVSSGDVRSIAQTLSKIIFNNFIKLNGINYVTHSVNDIHKLLSSDDMFGYFVFLNAQNGSKLISYLFGEISTMPDGRHAYYLSYIYVAPKFRQLRIGSLLMNKIIHHCKLTGIPFILLMCDVRNEKLVSFYKKFGFVLDPNLSRHRDHDVLCLYLSDV